MHTVMVKKNNDVLVFGANYYGQLGLGHNNDQNNPQNIDAEKYPYAKIACGIRHTVILQDNNDVLVFGANYYGQLGLGHNHNQNKPVSLRLKPRPNLPTGQGNIDARNSYTPNRLW